MHDDPPVGKPPFSLSRWAILLLKIAEVKGLCYRQMVPMRVFV